VKRIRDEEVSNERARISIVSAAAYAYLIDL
jgi:hypothetical protein